MRILYFMNHVGIGGAALALHDLIKELKENHQDVETIVITGSYNELNVSLTKLGVENYTAPFKNFLSSTKKPFFFWRAILQIRYRINKPNAIKKIEKLVDFKTINIIHSNLNRIDIGYYFSKKYNIKHIWHIREHGDKSFIMQVFSSYNPLLTDKNSIFIAISNSVKSFWQSTFINEQNIRMIYDGIDSSCWIKNDSKIKNQKLSFIFLGGYDSNKGQAVFIEAVKLLPNEIKQNIIIDFYGNGSKTLKQQLINTAQKNNLDSFCTFYDYDPNIYKLIGKYHVGVNCSKFEGFGRVTVEYMMAGLCPLVSKSGANTEIVDDGVTGLVFNRDSSDDIAQKVIYIYNNRQLLENISKKAKIKALNTFSMKGHANEIYNLYKQTIVNG